MKRHDTTLEPEALNGERLYDHETEQTLRVVGISEDLNVVETVDEDRGETVALELKGDDSVFDRLGDDLSIIGRNGGGDDRVAARDRGVEILDQEDDDSDIIDAGDDAVIL